jgi:hypothetical protein
VTFAQAAEHILREQARPMTATEITEMALTMRLVTSSGKTPVATMAAALYGLPAGSSIEREYVAGGQRARRGSVRWRYVSGRAGAASSRAVRRSR